MATVQAPLLSVTAKGSIGNTITFTSGNGKNIVKGSYLRKYNGIWFKREIAENESIKQKAIRCCFSNGAKAWNILPQEAKAVFEDQAKGRPLTGFNLFIMNYINDNYDSQIFTVAYLFGICFNNIVMLNKLGCLEEVLISRLYERNNSNRHSR